MQYREVAREVTRREGKKISVTVAQVDEVLRVFFDLCAEVPYDEAMVFFQKQLEKRQTKKRKGVKKNGRSGK